MIAPALRRIEADLRAMIADPDMFTKEELRLQIRRVDALAEMVEGGIVA